MNLTAKHDPHKSDETATTTRPTVLMKCIRAFVA